MVNVAWVPAAFTDERGDFLDVALGTVPSNDLNYTPTRKQHFGGVSGSNSGKSRIHGAW